MASALSTGPGRRLLAYLLVVGAGALAGLAYAVAIQPSYTATAYVAVVPDAPGDNLAAVGYAQAYARIALQGEVVASEGGGSAPGASAADLRRQVRASSSPDAPIIEIAATADRPQRAAELANLVAQRLVDSARSLRTQTRMALVLLGSADPPPESTSPRVFISMAVGAVVGVLLVALWMVAGGWRPSGSPSPRLPAPPSLAGSWRSVRGERPWSVRTWRRSSM